MNKKVERPNRHMMVDYFGTVNSNKVWKDYSIAPMFEWIQYGGQWRVDCACAVCGCCYVHQNTKLSLVKLFCIEFKKEKATWSRITFACHRLAIVRAIGSGSIGGCSTPQKLNIPSIRKIREFGSAIQRSWLIYVMK